MNTENSLLLGMQEACTEAHTSSQPPASQENAKRSSPPPSIIRQSMPKSQGRKRASSGGSAPEKRRRKQDANSDDSRSDEEQTAKKGPLASIEMGMSDSDAAHSGSPTPKRKSEAEEPKAEGSESEMSIVIDEVPKKRRRGRKPKHATAPAKEVEKVKCDLSEVVDAEEPQKGKRRKSGSAKPQVKSIDPEMDEIKRLQSWLVKCGVRKVWGGKHKSEQPSLFLVWCLSLRTCW